MGRPNRHDPGAANHHQLHPVVETSTALRSFRRDCAGVVGGIGLESSGGLPFDFDEQRPTRLLMRGRNPLRQKRLPGTGRRRAVATTT